MAQVVRPDDGTIRVPLHFEGGDDLPILYASNVFVRWEPHAFLISFAQVHGPYQVNPDPKELEEAGIVAKVIGRFAFPPNKWKEILDVLNDNYRHWEAIHGKQGEEQESPEPPSPSLAVATPRTDASHQRRRRPRPA